MLRIAVLLLCFSSLCATGQTPDKVYTLKHWDTAYCYYYELGEKIQNLFLAYDKQHTPKDKYKDIMYKSPSGERVIYITAKLLSSPKLKTITPYYNIEFEGCDTSLDIRYHPYTIEYFNDAILKHQIIRNNALDKDAVNQLIKEWKRKASIITEEELATGSNCNYNSSPYTVDIYMDSSLVQIRGKEIYMADKLFASYSSNKMTYATDYASKEDLFFYLTSPGGIRIAEVKLIALYPYIIISSPHLQEPLRAYIPVREEKRLMMLCTKILQAYLAKQ